MPIVIIPLSDIFAGMLQFLQPLNSHAFADAVSKKVCLILMDLSWKMEAFSHSMFNCKTGIHLDLLWAQ